MTVLAFLQRSVEEFACIILGAYVCFSIFQIQIFWHDVHASSVTNNPGRGAFGNFDGVQSNWTHSQFEC